MGTIQGLFRGIALLPKNMRHYIVKLQQSDNSIINSVIIASSAESAQAIVLKIANKIITSSFCKDSEMRNERITKNYRNYRYKIDVFTECKELKVIGVEEWENNSLKVIKGQRKYGVVIYLDGENPYEFVSENLAGFKSAYSYFVKSLKLKGKFIMFIRELEHLVKVDGYTFEMLSQTLVECPYSTSADGVLVIPSTINGVEVKRIGERVCRNYYDSDCENNISIFEKLFVPNTFMAQRKRIETGNYGKIPGQYIKHLVLPDTVIAIEDEAFRWCNMETVKLSKNLKYIGRCAFADNELTNITFHNGLEVIREGAFINNRLKYIKLPNTIKKVGDGAFENNNNIKVKR